MFTSRVLGEIATLDAVKDHQRIVLLSTRVDFPFDTTRALELALFRTFGVPSISALLHRTGEFERRAQKRYDDTDIIVSATARTTRRGAIGSRRRTARWARDRGALRRLVPAPAPPARAPGDSTRCSMRRRVARSGSRRRTR